MEFVLVPAGEFMMGSEKGASDEEPVHRVRITKAFYLGKYEVTQRVYAEAAGKNPSRFKGERNPVECVSWQNATGFCKQLSDRWGVDVRLPTEAEWEYACRAGTGTRFSFGDQYSQIGKYGWYEINSGGKAHAVGGKRPNPWGLYDMHGNVWEWCWDGLRRYDSAPRTDPRGPASGSRALRGGSCDDDLRHCRSAYRCGNDPAGTCYGIGFRVFVVCSRSSG